MFRFVDASTEINTTRLFSLKLDTTAKGILVRFSGTNKTGQQLALSDFGNLILYLADGVEQRVAIKLSHLNIFNKIGFGYVLESSTSGGAFDFAFYLPFFNPLYDENNAIPISKNDYITIDGISSTIASTGLIAVYLDIADNPTLYIPNIFTRTETLSSEKPIFLPEKNIFGILIKEPSTPPSQIILTRDGYTILDVPYSVVEISSNLFGKIESSPLDFAFLNLGQYFACAGKNYYMKMTGGSGTLEYTTFAFDGVEQIVRGNKAIIVPKSDIEIRPKVSEIVLKPATHQAPARDTNIAFD